MTRRLLFIRQTLPFLKWHIFQPGFLEPLCGRRFALTCQLLRFRSRKTQEALYVFSLLRKSTEVLLFQERRVPFSHLRGGECRVHAVVVTRGQRIELVVVTFKTPHCGAEKSLANGVHDVIEKNLPRFRHLHHRRIPRAHAQETCGHEQCRITLAFRLLLP